MSDDPCTCDSPEDSAGLHHREWCGQPITGPAPMWEAMDCDDATDDSFYDDFDEETA